MVIWRENKNRDGLLAVSTENTESQHIETQSGTTETDNVEVPQSKARSRSSLRGKRISVLLYMSAALHSSSVNEAYVDEKQISGRRFVS